MVDICRSEFDRLIEQSPPIPGDVLRMFEKHFEGKDVTLPEISTVKPIDPFDGSREAVITSTVAKRFLETRPVISTKHSVEKELDSLKAKGLVTSRRNEEFYDCELGLGENVIDGINLEENEDKDSQDD